MAKTKSSEVIKSMAADDPRRPLMLRRLKAARARIDEFLHRSPELSDPAYEEWEQSVHALLTDLFGASSYLLKFRQIHPRPISYQVGGYRTWHSEPDPAWQSGLQRVARLLDEALEEAEIEMPVVQKDTASVVSRQTPIVINIQNTFSPTIHITITQVLQRLDELDLSPTEKALATEYLRELDTETREGKRWPIIARCLDTIKSIGKNVYKDLAVPLLVEFLKRESGLGM